MNHQNGIWNKIFIFIIITMMWLQSGIHEPETLGIVPGGPRMHSNKLAVIRGRNYGVWLTYGTPDAREAHPV